MGASVPSGAGSPHVRIRQALAPAPAPAAPADTGTSSAVAVPSSRVTSSRVTNARDTSAVALLGARIRKARLQQVIGVRELARRIECSASMISQIEKGLTNPSVSTLYSISRALGISTDTLIAGAEPLPARTARDVRRADLPPSDTTSPRTVPLVLHPEDRRVIDLEHGVRWELLMPMPEANAEFMEVTYGVGGGSTDGEHAIRHNGREYSVILEGNLSVQVGFEQYVLEPGDSMAFDSTIPHRFWNAGTVPVRGIWYVVDRWSTVDDL